MQQALALDDHKSLHEVAAITHIHFNSSWNTQVGQAVMILQLIQFNEPSLTPAFTSKHGAVFTVSMFPTVTATTVLNLHGGFLLSQFVLDKVYHVAGQGRFVQSDAETLACMIFIFCHSCCELRRSICHR